MINLIKSTFYNEEGTKKKLCEFIKGSKHLSMGKKCGEFEHAFSKYQGRKYSVMFNSGSSANLALTQSLVNLSLLKRGDKAGFSSLTWSTNVMPLIQADLEPVPIDVSLKSVNVDSKNLLQVLENTDLSALFITNLLGFCADIDKISKICKEKGILLIEDNCESLGSTLNNKKLGNFGLASSFSFFVGHHMSTIEGGMVCTDDEEIYNMLLMVRAHGWDRNLDSKRQDKIRKENNIDDFHAKYTFYCLGYNLRPTEINAFLGLEQLNYIGEITKIRSKNFGLFHNVAKKNRDFYDLDVSHMSFVSNFAYPLVCKDGDLFDEYKRRFVDNCIEIRPIVAGSMVEQPFFRNLNKGKVYKCENAKKANDFGFYFPNFPEMNAEEKNLIVDLLKSG